MSVKYYIYFVKEILHHHNSLANNHIQGTKHRVSNGTV